MGDYIHSVRWKDWLVIIVVGLFLNDKNDVTGNILK